VKSAKSSAARRPLHVICSRKVQLSCLPRASRVPAYLCLLLAVSVRNSAAPETPREPLLRQRDPLAGEYLRARLAVWQQRLSLQDWKISITMTHSTGLRGGTLGNIRWDADNKIAMIRVRSASEYAMPYAAALKDMEFTVVHELIHLELASLPRSEASRREEEHAVNHMAGALLDLDRKD
jgi:hypothetical protein